MKTQQFQNELRYAERASKELKQQIVQARSMSSALTIPNERPPKPDPPALDAAQ